LTRLMAGKRQNKETNESVETVPADRFAEDLRAYISHLPETTVLVLVETQSLPAGHPLKAVMQNGVCAGEIREFRPFSAMKKEGPTLLAQWIKERGKAKGVDWSADAIQALAAHIGYDLRLLDQELEKLAVHSGGARVTSNEVRELVSAVREADIFEMVDAFGRRDVKKATLLMHQMLDEGKHALYLLSMIARQFRILVQVKELTELPDAEAARELKLHEFVFKKGKQQARNFTFQELHAIYERLVQTDEAVKTGKLTDTLALDLFIAEVCRS
jgi:DNA polymerase III subunit delta